MFLSRGDGSSEAWSPPKCGLSAVWFLWLLRYESAPQTWLTRS